MSRRSFLYLLAVAAILFIAGSCSSDGCLSNQNALPLAEFYSAKSDKQVSVRGVEISGVGAPGDSVLIAPTQSVSKVYLPMRSDRSSTEWQLRFEAENTYISDFITFDYNSEPHFVSEECGAMYFYRITRVGYTTNVIDSVVVTDSLINNYDFARIRIYLHEEDPAEETEDEAQEEPEV